MAARNSKRQKTEVSEEQLLQDLGAVQDRINEMDKELAEKMLALTKEYTTKKAPLYAERQTVAEGIPSFWSKVLLSWPPIEDILCDEDEDALKHLTSVMFEERDAPEEYKLVFTFDRNPYFSDTQLWKVITTASRLETDQDDEDEPLIDMGARVVEASGINWKNTEQAQALKSRVDAAVGEAQDDDEDEDDSGAGSIFMLFHPNDQNAEVVELIRTEVFQDPTNLFNDSDDIEEDEL